MCAFLGSFMLGQGFNSEPIEFILTKAGLKAQPDVCFLMIFSSSFTRSNYSDPKSHQINSALYSLCLALLCLLPPSLCPCSFLAWGHAELGEELCGKWVSIRSAINRGELHRLAVQIQVTALCSLWLAFTMHITSLRLTCSRHRQGHKANPID